MIYKTLKKSSCMTNQSTSGEWTTILIGRVQRNYQIFNNNHSKVKG